MLAIRFLLWLSVAGLWGLTAWLYPHLPDRIPMHFDGAGVPDRFVDRTVWNWCLLPGIATLLTGMLAWLVPAWFRRMSDRGSRWLNMPDQRRFLQLPADARRRALLPMIGALQLIAVLVLWLFSFVMWATSEVATGARSTLPTLPFWLLTVGMAVLALATLPLGMRAVAREYAATAGAASPR